MHYNGGKWLEKKHFLPGLKRLIKETKAKAYYEPFVGSGSVIIALPSTIARYGSDKSLYMIDFLRSIRDGWRPEYIADEEQRRARWEYVKKNKSKVKPAEVAFWGYGLSYRGNFFKSFSKGGRNAGGSTYYENALSSIEKQAPKLKGIRFHCHDYREKSPVYFERPLVVYCDPPYANTEEINFKFKSEEFWEWARYRAVGDIFILVSEYSAPEDFEPVLTYQKTSRLSWQRGPFLRQEHVFAHKTQAAFIREVFNDARGQNLELFPKKG